MHTENKHAPLGCLKEQLRCEILQAQVREIPGNSYVISCSAMYLSGVDAQILRCSR